MYQRHPLEARYFQQWLLLNELLMLRRQLVKIKVVVVHHGDLDPCRCRFPRCQAPTRERSHFRFSRASWKRRPIPCTLILSF